MLGSMEENLNEAIEKEKLYITSGNIGRVPEYSTNEDFTLYLERLEQYFSANFVEEQRKVAVLLTVMGPEPYKILRNLCDPQLPKDKYYEELCKLLLQQFTPRASIFRKRIEFYEVKQNRGESINEWYARIKNLAMHCKFGNLLEEKLKDKFVCGLRKGLILDRICEEEEEKKTLQEFLEVAVRKEASLKQANTESFYKIEADGASTSGQLERKTPGKFSTATKTVERPKTTGSKVNGPLNDRICRDNEQIPTIVEAISNNDSNNVTRTSNVTETIALNNGNSSKESEVNETLPVSSKEVSVININSELNVNGRPKRFVKRPEYLE